MDSKLISVVIPTYNRSKTILRAVNSAIGQTYSNIEIIVVDDCSSDNTINIIDAIDDDRLRLIRNGVNSGACKSRNIGIAASSGDYVAFLDSDDEWLPLKLEKQVAALESTGCDVAFCRFKQIFTEADAFSPLKEAILPRAHDGLVEREALVKQSIVSTQTIVAKRGVFEKVIFDEAMPRLQDYEWTIRASKEHSFYLVDDVLVNVYLQNDSITNSGVQKQFDALNRILEKNAEPLADEPRMLSSLYLSTGACGTKLGLDPRCYYGKALALGFDIKTAIKYTLALLGYYR